MSEDSITSSTAQIHQPKPKIWRIKSLKSTTGMETAHWLIGVDPFFINSLLHFLQIYKFIEKSLSSSCDQLREACHHKFHA